MTDAPVNVIVNDQVDATIVGKLEAIATAALKSSNSVDTLNGALRKVDQGTITNELNKYNVALVTQSKNAGNALDAETKRINAMRAQVQINSLLGVDRASRSAAASAAVFAAAGPNDLEKQLSNTASQMRKFTVEANDNTTAVGLNRMQQMELMHVARALADSIAAGVNPIRAVTMEMGRLSQVAASGGGVQSLISGLGSLVSRVLNPVVLGIGAVVIAVGLAATAFLSLENQAAATNAVLQGLGRNVGLSTDQFNRMATVSAAAGKVSVTQAINLGQELARTGNIGADSISTIIKLSRDFAVTMGTDVAGAAQKLAASFSSLSGIEALNRELRFLDGTTLKLVQDLFAQGREQEAILVALGQLPTALTQAERGTSGFGQAVENVKRQLSDAYTAYGRFIGAVKQAPAAISPVDAPKLIADVQSAQTNLDQLKGKLTDLQAVSKAARPIVSEPIDLGEQGANLKAAADNARDYLRQQQSNLYQAFTPRGPQRLTATPFGDLLPDIETLKVRIATAEEILKRAQSAYDNYNKHLKEGAEATRSAETAADQAGQNRLATQFKDLNSQLAPASDNAQDLYSKLRLVAQVASTVDLSKVAGGQTAVADTRNRLNEAIRNGTGIDNAASLSQDQFAAALDRSTAAGRNYFDTATRENEIRRLNNQLTDAESTAERAAIQAKITRIQQVGQLNTAAQNENQLRLQTQGLIAEESKARSDELYVLDREAGLYGTVGRAREVGTALLQREIAAYGAKQAYSDRDLAAVRQRLEAQYSLNQLQTASNQIFSQSIQPAETYAATLEAATRLLKEGKISVDQFNLAVSESRIKMQEASLTIGGGFEAAFLKIKNDYNNVAGTISNGIGNIAKQSEDALVTFATTGKLKFADLAKAIEADLIRVAIRLMIIRPLMNAIFGDGTGGAGGGIVGMLQGLLPGHAAGTAFLVGGKPGVDQNLVAFRASANERVTVETPAQQAARMSDQSAAVTTIVQPKATQVNVHNYGSEVAQKTSSTYDTDMIDIWVRAAKDAVAADIMRGGTKLNRAHEARYGLNASRGNTR